MIRTIIFSWLCWFVWPANENSIQTVYVGPEIQDQLKTVAHISIYLLILVGYGLFPSPFMGDATYL
jgi:hypothetical protein